MLDILNLSVRKSSDVEQTDMTVWNSEEMNWLETGTEMVIKLYFKS